MMRDFLNIAAHMIGKASGSNSETHIQSHTKRARHDGNSNSSSYQGVVALPNGNWAAYVYVNDNLILKGTFETEKEAVMAYESKTLELRMKCCKQELVPLKHTSIDNIHSSSSVYIPGEHENQECIRTHLFGKVLTTSDVNVRIDKLVIPKIYAGCFPSITEEDESSMEVQPVNDVQLEFYDQSMTLWKFRYCYWKRSKTYSFSRGWRKFVEEKGLSSMDKVIFYKCERVVATSVVDTYYMIDVEYANEMRVEKVVGNMEESVVCSRSEGVQILQNEENGGGTADVGHVTKILADKDSEGPGAGGVGAGAWKASESEKSVRLFGVNIAEAGAEEASEATVKLFGVNITGAGARVKDASEKNVKLFGVNIA